MGLFDRDYDRNFGYRGGSRGSFNAGYDRGMNNTFNRATYTPAGQGRNAGYGGEFGARRSTGGYGADYAGRGSTAGYDRPYWGYDTARYDENYKSRQQTDAGDPFGDRQAGTPIRVMDEHRDRGGYDRGWFGFGGGRGYDRGMRYDNDTRYGNDMTTNRRGFAAGSRSANPMGYDPYDNRGVGGRGGYDAGFRNNRGGYDRDWF
jgi:hypothetical protein